MANLLSTILRVVCLLFLSSFSNAPCPWQKSHSTPSEAVMNCMVGNICSAGTPLRTWMFLNCSSAFSSPACGPALGPECGVPLDCAFAPPATTAQTAMDPAIPSAKGHVLFIDD